MDTSPNWYDLSTVEIQQQLEGYTLQNQKELGNKDLLKSIFSCIDLTTLEGTDHNERISQFCQKALSFVKIGLPLPAAVCVYPLFVRAAKKYLKGSGIHVAAVTGHFPSGQAPLFLKMEELKYTLDEGAEEIDFVISRGRFLEGDMNYIYDEISSARELSKDIPLKVILETGELKTNNNIRKASEIAIAAGADFIKTSTGKTLPAATAEAAFIMIHVIQDHYLRTGRKIGFKPSGGIVESSQAMGYFLLVRQILGCEWMISDYFRIGASRLADNLAREISG